MQSRRRHLNGLAFLGVLSLGLIAVPALEAQVQQGLNITSGPPPGGAVGTPYSFTFTAQDICSCSPQYSWSSQGYLPQGLTLDSETGILSGTPTGGGTYQAVITVTDNGNDDEQATQNVAINIAGKPANTAVVVNVSSANVSGDLVSAYQFITVPFGSTATCNGVSGACGPGNVSEVAVDSAGNYIVVLERSVEPPSNSSIVKVTPAGVVTVMNTDGSGISNFKSIAIDAQGNYIVADMGNQTHQLLKFAPTVNSVEAVVGTLPATSTTANVQVRIDATGNYVTAQDTLTGTIAITRITPDTSHTITHLSFTSDNGPTSIQGSLRGFTIDGNGNYIVIQQPDDSDILSVTPAGVVSSFFGNGNFDLEDPNSIFWDSDQNQFLITDDEVGKLFSLSANGDTLTEIATGGTLTVPISVSAKVSAAVQPPSGPSGPPATPPVQISGQTNLGDFATGKSISASYSVTGGTPPYTLTAGGLPTGVSFNAGTLSGAPSAPGTYFVSINATDSAGKSGFLSVSFSVLGFNNTSLPPASAFIRYSSAVSAAGGVPPYTYSGSGTPAGISVYPDGTIVGTTPKTGSYSVAVTASDSGGATVTSTFTLVVATPSAVKVPGGALTSVTIQNPSSQVLSATGGAPPYSWTVAAGALPGGLSLLTSGTLSGVPTKVGAFSFTARATDTSGGSANGVFTITVNPQPITINAPSPLSSGMVSVDYPVQTLSASGGVAPYQYKVTTGSLPAGLTLSTTGAISGTPTTTGNSSFTITASDSSTPAATATASLTVAVRPFSGDLLLSAGAVSFSVAVGSTNVPATQVVQVQSTDPSQTLGYSATVSGSPSWLSLGTPSGATPGSVSISLTDAALALTASGSPYSASVVVACTSGGCNGRSQTIGVSLVVTATSPQLSLVNDSLAFDTIASAPQATSQTVGISNTGGGSLGIASVTCGASWCQPSSQISAIGGGSTATINVVADPSGLNAGYYYTNLLVHSSAGNATIPVTFQIAANGTMTLNPAGEQFSLPQGGAAVGETSFFVTITGPNSVSFQAAVSLDAPWLSVTPTSGTASGTKPADLNLVFDQTKVAALAPGTYYATVQITSTGAVNSPQSFEVVLNVTPATTRTTPNLVPGGLLFLTQAGANPPPQTVAIYSGSPNATPYQASASTASNGTWLNVSPSTGSTSSTAPGQATVNVTPGSLKPGIYTGTVNYSYAGAAVRSVNVTMVVEAAASGTSGREALSSRAVPPAIPGCTATRVVPTSTALVSNFAAPAAWPVEMAITVVDDCGGPVGNGQVVVTFSNGDPPLLLNSADPNNGLYDGTWTPRHNAAQTTITARATAAGLAASSIQIAGAVTPNSAPVLLHNSTANFFNPIGGAPLAPGTLIQLSGQYLSSQNVINSTIPVPTILGGTSVLIGGIPAPVTFVSPGQIDAQVPFELPPGQPYQVIVNANGALTTPDGFEAGSTSPGLSVQTDGLVRANHQDGTAVSETAPAKPGEFISIYLVGMGATDVPVASGAASPSSPIANASNAPAVTLNGEPVTFDFAGLSPGLVGVYQVNLQVPADAADGDLVLLLASDGATSNSGVLPVHK